MSYKFTLDHKLELENIHDMITIDMQPATECVVSKDTIQMTGHFSFEGTFLTVELEEAPFEGVIPIDITLPYFGGATDVRLEMVTFDYHVVNKASLSLKFDMIILGYEGAGHAVDAIVTEHLPHKEEAMVTEEIPYSPLVPVTPENMREEPIREEACEMVETEVEPQLEEVPVVDYQSQFFEIPVVSDEDFYKRVPEPNLTLEEVPMPAFEEVPVVPIEDIQDMEIEREEAPVEMLEEAEEDLEQPEKATAFADSVARQFSDGQTTVKMVYVRRESELLGEVLERNAATLDDVWNLSKLDDVVHAGDCVMIKYDKSE